MSLGASDWGCSSENNLTQMEIRAKESIEKSSERTQQKFFKLPSMVEGQVDRLGVNATCQHSSFGKNQIR